MPSTISGSYRHIDLIVRAFSPTAFQWRVRNDETSIEEIDLYEDILDLGKTFLEAYDDATSVKAPEGDVDVHLSDLFIVSDDSTSFLNRECFVFEKNPDATRKAYQHPVTGETMWRLTAVKDHELGTTLELCDELGSDAVEAYFDVFGVLPSCKREFHERLIGHFDSEAEFGEQMFEMIEGEENFSKYRSIIDFPQYVEELRKNSFHQDSCGFYFRVV